MSRKSATTSRPISAAFFACFSESLPSVAETSVRSICLNSTGRAPVWSTSARSFASPALRMPVIRAPWTGSIPPGNSLKSIDGKDLMSRSRTIAKCWLKLLGSEPWPKRA